ncbi:MAG TPA: hypothetical protein VFH72_06585 [Candidatus Baltobacteraceae bacterium]|nr:hypothetical protein [Candidatus Baltobacteraceae bacterium]
MEALLFASNRATPVKSALVQFLGISSCSNTETFEDQADQGLLITAERALGTL